MAAQPKVKLPPGQQLVARDKWPVMGQREAAPWQEPWRVSVAGLVGRPREFTLDELRSLPRFEAEVDIHCVTRWSRPAVRFAGVTLAEVLRPTDPLETARFVSFVAHTDRDHSTSLLLDDALRLGALLAWEADGQPLAAAHGGPLRVVVPGRYFYKSLKWVARIELLAEDRLGYWEATAGYHNTADPWREQRYMQPSLSRAEMRQVLAARDVSGRDLRGLAAADHDLQGLNAQGALLRDADFRRARLAGADFRRANLTNAHFNGADLRGAKWNGADCEGADFCGADLRGADFSGASLVAAMFCPEADGQPLAGPAALLDHTTRLPGECLDQLTPLQAAWIARWLPRT